MKRKRRTPLSVPEKANRLLVGFIIALSIITLRIWHVAVLQHEKKKEEAYRPQRRSVPEHCDRAGVCDRFGKTLAENVLQYNVGISYRAIRDIPTRVWHTDEQGNKRLVPVRKDYIKKFADFLAQELHMDRDFVEDTIHAKASVLGSVPYILQANVSERTFLRLKMLEKDWPGLHVESSVRRHYPEGRTVADLLGYVGPISVEEHRKITRELGNLREYIRAYEEGEDPKFPAGISSVDQVRKLLHELEMHAYGLNSLIGKLGVEAFCDRKLRGLIGKRSMLVDRRGNFIQEMEGSSVGSPGRKIQLTISTELQAFAHELLAEHERGEVFRDYRQWRQQQYLPPFFPWIKGGAIVAMDPKNGQILAMASSPRYNNNDFINMKDSPNQEECRSSVLRWLENLEYIGEVFDRRVPLRRERLDPLSGKYFDEELSFSYRAFLDFILPDTSKVKQMLCEKGSVGLSIYLQGTIEQLLEMFECEEKECGLVFDVLFPKEDGHEIIGEVTSLKRQKQFKAILAEREEEVQAFRDRLGSIFADLSANYDKILFLDLLRTAVDPEKVSISLLAEIGHMSVLDFVDYQGHFIALRKSFAKLMENAFIDHDFTAWREEHFTQFIKQKRDEELERKQRYPTPYVDYLVEERSRQYALFCREHMDSFITFLLSEIEPPLGNPYYQEIACWRQELRSGAYPALEWREHYDFLHKHLSQTSYDLCELFAAFREFSELKRPLYGQYPLTLTRNIEQIEQDLIASFYPLYGYGHLSAHAFGQAATLGSIFKLVSAYSVLVQHLSDQEDLSKLLVILDKQSLGLRSGKPHVGFFKDGSPIASFFKGGILPGNDYSGRGYIDLIAALEMSSNPYFSLLVSEYLSDPEDLCEAAKLFGFGEKTGIGLPGEYAGRVPIDIAYNRSGLYATAIGQHTLVVTPLQTAVMMATLVNGGIVYQPSLIQGEWYQGSFSPEQAKKKREIFLPDPIVDLFKRGMHNVIWGQYGTTRFMRQRFAPERLARIIGKTSTAEVIARVGLDRERGRMKLKDVWFAAVGYEDEALSHPDIVVVVYLRLGEFGRDAAPMAVRMIEKWEEIRKKSFS